MDWKLEEDIVCCDVCVYEYVIEKNDTNINACIEKIKQHASIYKRDSGSIRERIKTLNIGLRNCMKKIQFQYHHYHMLRIRQKRF